MKFDILYGLILTLLVGFTTSTLLILSKINAFQSGIPEHILNEMGVVCILAFVILVVAQTVTSAQNEQEGEES